MASINRNIILIAIPAIFRGYSSPLTILYIYVYKYNHG